MAGKNVLDYYYMMDVFYTPSDQLLKSHQYSYFTPRAIEDGSRPYLPVWFVTLSQLCWTGLTRPQAPTRARIITTKQCDGDTKMASAALPNSLRGLWRPAKSIKARQSHIFFLFGWGRAETPLFAPTTHEDESEASEAPGGDFSIRLDKYQPREETDRQALPLRPSFPSSASPLVGVARGSQGGTHPISTDSRKKFREKYQSCQSATAERKGIISASLGVSFWVENF